MNWIRTSFFIGIAASSPSFAQGVDRLFDAQESALDRLESTDVQRILESLKTK